MSRSRGRRAAPVGVALILEAGLVTGCAQWATETLFEHAQRTLERQYVQELNNIALFLAEPEALPRHVRIHRGTVEFRPEPKWSIGTDTYIAGATRMSILWEISAVTDLGDLQRMRLLYQWVTKHISFDEFAQRWGEIRDQPEFGPNGTQRFEESGRPVLGPAPLPIASEANREWYTTNQHGAVAGLDRGEYRGVKVWIKDLRGASLFVLAVQRAMPNTKPPPALPMPGR